MITAVATVSAPIDDSRRICGVHAELAAAGRTPAENFVDAGYTSAAPILEVAGEWIDLVGPVPIAGGRQAHADNAGSTRRSMDSHGSTSTSTVSAAIPARPRSTAPPPAAAISHCTRANSTKDIPNKHIERSFCFVTPWQIACLTVAQVASSTPTYFAMGREEVVALLTRKWNTELEYRLIKGDVGLRG